VTPGLYHNVPDAVYRAWPGANQTMLKTVLAQSYAHWLERAKKPATDAMTAGSAIDCWILEPDTFDQRFVAPPDVPRRSKADKETWAAAEAEAKASGQRLLKGDAAKSVEVAKAIHANILAHPVASVLLRHARAQVSLYWLDGLTQEPCKGRLDMLCRGDEVAALVDAPGCVADLKTVGQMGKAEAAQFGRDQANSGGLIQAAFYVDGLRALTGYELPWLWIVAERVPPYAVAVHRASDSALAVGRRQYTRALKRLREQREPEAWTGYPTEITEIAPPVWLAMEE